MSSSPGVIAVAAVAAFVVAMPPRAAGGAEVMAGVVANAPRQCTVELLRNGEVYAVTTVGLEPLAGMYQRTVSWEVPNQGRYAARIVHKAAGVAVTRTARLRPFQMRAGVINLGTLRIDDATPAAVKQVPAGDVAKLGLSLAAAVPNPLRDRTQIRFSVPERGRVRLRVFDAAGRLVRRVLDLDTDAGAFTVEFDGRDEAGRMLAAGVYAYRLEANGRALSRTVIVTPR